MHEPLEHFIGKKIPATSMEKYQIQFKDNEVIVYDEIDGPIGSDCNKNVENQIYIRWDDYNQCTIQWFQHGQRLVELKNIAVKDVITLDDSFEKSMTFRLARTPSKMFKVQLKPSFFVQYGVFFDVCEDCE
ncbi:MAG: DUF3979 family protein [Bacillaceae bacterium]